MESPSGLARVNLRLADRARAWLLLGHGAGGGVEAPDLMAASGAALAEGVNVGLVEQPYRVAGWRSPAPAGRLDAAWVAVIDCLREGELGGLPLLVGDRSSGARVACRTATVTDAVAVVCLAFPLQPPRLFGPTPAKAQPTAALENASEVGFASPGRNDNPAPLGPGTSGVVRQVLPASQV